MYVTQTKSVCSKILKVHNECFLELKNYYQSLRYEYGHTLKESNYAKKKHIISPQ